MTQDHNRTYLAVDYGRRRVGLAKTDPLGVIPSALQTLEVRSMSEAVIGVAAIIQEYQPAALVIGYPLHASGDKSEMCEEIDTFLEKLQKHYNGPVHRVDEYGSSADARSVIHSHGKKVGKKKQRVDRLAAVVILQRFLDEHPSN